MIDWNGLLMNICFGSLIESPLVRVTASGKTQEQCQRPRLLIFRVTHPDPIGLEQAGHWAKDGPKKVECNWFARADVWRAENKAQDPGIHTGDAASPSKIPPPQKAALLQWRMKLFISGSVEPPSQGASLLLISMGQNTDISGIMVSVISIESSYTVVKFLVYGLNCFGQGRNKLLWKNKNLNKMKCRRWIWKFHHTARIAHEYEKIIW